MADVFDSALRRQDVHDAALRLQLVRARLCDEWAARGQCDAEVLVFADPADLKSWLRDLCAGAGELAAVTSLRQQTVEGFMPAHRVNEGLVARGVMMTSLFDPSVSSPAMLNLLIAARSMPYYFAYGPYQIKVVDRSRVVVEGPRVATGHALMVMSGTEAVAAANQYIRAVRSTAVRAGELRSGPVELSPRQHVIASLLRDGCTDEDVAGQLGVSVRTVRYDVARLLDALGVRTRFAAGVSYAALNAVEQRAGCSKLQEIRAQLRPLTG